MVQVTFVAIVYGRCPLILMLPLMSMLVIFDDIWGIVNLSGHTMLSWILPCPDAWPALA